MPFYFCIAHQNAMAVHIHIHMCEYMEVNFELTPQGTITLRKHSDK